MVGKNKVRRPVNLDGIDDVHRLMELARKSYDEDVSTDVQLCCKKIFLTDPENAEAWDLMAKVGDWDSLMYELDIDGALEDIHHALALRTETERPDAAAQIYTARKAQIAHLLESEMMMPTYTTSKQMHETMQWWLRFLKETPYLTSDLIEREVTLCENMCLRSKLGVMPGDRLVYTAYATFNKKESYGETFRKELSTRLDAEKVRQLEQVSAARAEDRQREADYKRLVQEGGLEPDQEKIWLEYDAKSLEAELANLVSYSDINSLRRQKDEMLKRLAQIKPYKLIKRHELEERIADMDSRIAEVEDKLQADCEPVKKRYDFVQKRLAELG